MRKNRKQVSRAIRVLPPTLEIYVTNRCNLNCTYCSSRLLKTGAAAALTFDMIKSAVDIFSSWTDPALLDSLNINDPENRAIGFTGAEPLLEFDTVLKASGYVRKKYPWLVINISTNGTLLTPQRAGALQALGVNISMSLDGTREINDLHRRFIRDKDRSVWKTVTQNLKLIPPRSVGLIRAVTTFTPETVNSAVETAKLLSRFGFKTGSMNFDVYEPWSGEKQGILRRAVGSFLAHHEAELVSRPDRGAPATECFFEYNLDNLHKKNPFFRPSEITLSPDGFFYPCDALCVHGRKEYSVGDLRTGINLEKLEKLYAEASKRLARFPYANSAISGVDRYFHARLSGLSADAMLRGADNLGRILHQELAPAIEINDAFGRLRRNKTFGDLTHEPARRGLNEIARLRVETPLEDPGLGRVRDALDFFLYSPGGIKEATFTIENGRDYFRNFKLLSIYSIFKALRLKKKLKVIIEPRAGKLSSECRSFAEGHHLAVSGPADPGAGARGGPRLINISSAVPKSETVMIPAAGPGPDREAALEKLRRGIFASITGGRPVYAANLSPWFFAGCRVLHSNLAVDARGLFFLYDYDWGSASKKLAIGDPTKGLSCYGKCVYSPGRACSDCAGKSFALITKLNGEAASLPTARWLASTAKELGIRALKDRRFRDYIQTLADFSFIPDARLFG